MRVLVVDDGCAICGGRGYERVDIAFLDRPGYSPDMRLQCDCVRAVEIEAVRFKAPRMTFDASLDSSQSPRGGAEIETETIVIREVKP